MEDKHSFSKRDKVQTSNENPFNIYKANKPNLKNKLSDKKINKKTLASSSTTVQHKNKSSSSSNLILKPSLSYKETINKVYTKLNKVLLSYNMPSEEINKRIINDIIFDERKRIVSIFKDYLLWYETSDFFKLYYKTSKSIKMIKRFITYYESYTLFFPEYGPLEDILQILKKNIKRKKKYMERMEEDELDKLTNNDKKFERLIKDSEIKIYNSFSNSQKNSSKNTLNLDSMENYCTHNIRKKNDGNKDLYNILKTFVDCDDKIFDKKDMSSSYNFLNKNDFNYESNLVFNSKLKRYFKDNINFNDSNINDKTKEINKEKEKNKKIEKELLLSINNKEIITRERLNLAEIINFKDEPDKIILTDQFGFIKKEDPKILGKKEFKRKRSKSVASKAIKELLQINARLEKWNYMLQNYEEFYSKKRELLKSRTRKGIPDSLRGYVWQLFAEKEKYYIPNLYKDLETKPIKESLEITIMKDLDRTFPLCQFFREKYGNGQRKLYKVLSAYSKYNTDVGYVQGMGFITAIFLTYMDEESSFFMLHSLMKKYKMEGTFLNNFPDLRKKFFIFLNLQKKYIPKIYNILQRDKVVPTMYVSTWFISLFARSLEFQIVLRIFDCFFLEGFKVIYRVSLALLKLKENQFCKSHKGSSLPLLQNVTVNINEEELFKIAFAFNISRNYIEKLEAEYEKVKNDEKNQYIAQLFF